MTGPCDFIGCKSKDADYVETWLKFGKKLEPCSARLCSEHSMRLDEPDISKKVNWTRGRRISDML